MIIEQHYEKDGIRFTMQLVTLNNLTHKLFEGPKMEEAVKNVMFSTAPNIHQVLQHERERRNLT